MPIIVNYLFIVTYPHRKNVPQNAAWKLIIWSRTEKKISFHQLEKAQVPGIQSKTNNIEIVKINLFCHIKKEQNTKSLFFKNFPK